MLCIKHLHGRKVRLGRFCGHLVFLMFCPFIPAAAQFLCISHSFMMTKRDSHFAELPTPRSLCMESQDIDMPAAGPHCYIAPAIPGPDSHPQATSSTTPSVNNPPQIPPLSLPTVTFQGQPRQRVGHSILFKILEQPLPTGGYSRQVLVEETDARGYTKPKSLEFFFNGIIGHLRDRWGYALDNDRLCSQLANYWRHWFGAPTTGPVFEEYPDQVPWDHSEQEQTVTPLPSNEVTFNESAAQIPVQILQVAWFLQAFLEYSREGNAALIEEIQRTRPGTLRDLRAEGIDQRALANLFVDFGIMAQRLAQQHAANHPIETVEQEDDSS